MPEARSRCGECGIPLLDDPDHDAFDEAIHVCIIDEWLWFEYEPGEESQRS